MENIQISFPYTDALGEFVKLIVLASFLSFICTSLTEIFKNMCCNMLAEKNSGCIIGINGIICFLVGIFWANTFAQEQIPFDRALWLGLILWMGSQGLFLSFEQSDGFFGKYFRSLRDIVNETTFPDTDKNKDNDTDTDKEKDAQTPPVQNPTAEKPAEPEIIPQDTDSEFFRYPVNYIAISEPFSQNHYAVDFGWNRNYGGMTPDIYSAFSGTADMAGFYTGGAGNMVRIYFDDEKENCRWYAIYKHLSQVNVSKGDEVTMGDVIGKMGSTGDSTGNHLHFDLIKVPYGAGYTQTQSSRAKYSVDPLEYLYAYPTQTVGDTTDKKYTIMRFIKS